MLAPPGRPREGDDLRTIVAQGKLTMPVLAVDGGTGTFTSDTMKQVAERVTAVRFDRVGHLVAMEAPEDPRAAF